MYKKAKRSVVDPTKILIPDRHRKHSDELIAKLEQSIQEPDDMVHPVTCVDGARGEPILVAGYHRLQLAIRQKWDEIPVVIYPHKTDEATIELLEIDENLIRGELTADERAEHQARRKELMEARGLVRKPGGDGSNQHAKKSKEGQNVPLSSYAKTAAKEQGVSEKTVRRDLDRAKLIKQTRGTMLGTPSERDALAKLPAGTRSGLIKRAKAGVDVSAVKMVEAQEETPATDVQRAVVAAMKAIKELRAFPETAHLVDDIIYQLADCID